MKQENILHIIVNEGARTGKAAEIWRTVKTLLQEKGIAYKAYRTEYEGHATELARRLSEKDVPAVYLVVLGGDGTVYEVLNGITDFEKVRLGVIATGSGNDFGRGNNLAKDPKEALENILACMEREAQGTLVPRVDLGQVCPAGETPRIFGISAGVGLDAIVCKKALHSRLKTALNRLHLGKLTYILLTVQTLFSMDTAGMELEFDAGTENAGATKREKVIFAAAMNLRAEGGGVPMAPQALPDDGHLTLCSAFGIPKWRTFFCLPLLTAAKHERLKGFDVRPCRNVHLVIASPMVLHADGEYLGEVTDVTFTCLVGKLQLLS